MIKTNRVKKPSAFISISVAIITTLIGLVIIINVVPIIFSARLDDSVNVGSSFNPAGGLTYRLQSSVGTTNTSVKLSSLKNRSDIALTMTIMDTDIGYGTLSPQTSRSEFVSFTGITQNADGTATLTGVSRGLSDIQPFTASTTLREAHPGQSVFILSDSPQLFNEYAKRRSDEAITGLWNFNTVLPTSNKIATSGPQFVTKALLDATSRQGVATSTESNGGIVELATAVEAASSTPNVGSEKPLVLQTKYATDTPMQSTLSATKVVMSDLTGYLKQGWINLTEAFTWTGNQTWTGATNVFTNAAPRIGIGTSTPYATLSVVGETVSSYFTATSTTASSTMVDLVVSNNASTTNLTISGSCTNCVPMYYGAESTASGTADDTDVVVVGFQPRYIKYEIDAADANENSWAWGQWMDADGDGSGSYSTIQAETAFGSVQKQETNAHTNTFTDGQMIITCGSFTSTGLKE